MAWRWPVSCQGGCDPLVAGQLRATLIARPDMPYGLVSFRGFQGIEGEQGNELGKGIVIDHCLTPARETASFFMPLRIRLFTVPSGSPSLRATST